jgi:hypothetical protein
MTPEAYRKEVSGRGFIGNRNRRALIRYEEQKTDPTRDFPIYISQIGDVAFATNPFELYMDFMHRIQARSPFIQTFVTQLAGTNNSGYLATKRGAENMGYSASLFCNHVSAEGGQQLVNQTLSVLESFAEQK